jgi:hypothetical protein
VGSGALYDISHPEATIPTVKVGFNDGNTIMSYLDSMPNVSFVINVSPGKFAWIISY